MSQLEELQIFQSKQKVSQVSNKSVTKGKTNKCSDHRPCELIFLFMLIINIAKKSRRLVYPFITRHLNAHHVGYIFIPGSIRGEFKNKVFVPDKYVNES